MCVVHLGRETAIDYRGRMTEARERASERVAVDAFVKVHGLDGQELVFRTRDLSENGLFLYTKVARVYPIKVGSTLALELYDFDQHVACKVVVVRVVESGSAESDKFPTGFGVRIVELPEADRTTLRAMIHRIKSGEVY
jgi:PilZ domain-containing protein